MWSFECRICHDVCRHAGQCGDALEPLHPGCGRLAPMSIIAVDINAAVNVLPQYRILEVAVYFTELERMTLR